MKTKCMILSVPDQRKAEAVKNMLQSEISPNYPASIVREHPNCMFYLDTGSASLLD